MTITPTGPNFELTIDGEHRTIGPEIAADPLGDPEFEAIVQELKKDLERRSGTIVAPAGKPNQLKSAGRPDRVGNVLSHGPS